MLEIRISDELKKKIPELQLFCIECDVESGETPDLLWNQLTKKSTEISSRLKIEDISNLQVIKTSRKAYKACGKDPARYRLSAEALLRRIVKGEELYRISNVVDLLNLVSISSGFSIGGYDAEKVQGGIWFGTGKTGEPYSGIGRGELNIEGLPVFRDETGAFGSPTSDSPRTCVDGNTCRFLMIIISFGVNQGLSDAGEFSIALLRQFANADHIESKIIQ
jgi:DNA/RNA-binding domain of Phe-tRNA-synthetase-like protein